MGETASTFPAAVAWTVGGLLLVVAVTGLARRVGWSAPLVLVAVDRWRAGLVLIGCALVAGGLLRTLPERRLGFLAVRSRPIDVTLLLGGGLAVVVIALSLPAR